MKDIAFKLAEDLLCVLINDGDKRLNASLLEESRYREILDLAVEKMSRDQRAFYEKIIKRDEEDVRYYFLAGLPGTGKSYLQTVLHLYFTLDYEERRENGDFKVDFLCLAPTNLIAFQQSGSTIHKALKQTCENLKISNAKIETNLINDLVSTENYGNITKLKSLTVPELEEVIVKYYNETLLGKDMDLEDMYAKYRDDLPDDNLNVKIILIDEGSMVSSILMTLLSLQFPNSKFIIMYGPNQLPPVNGFPSCDEAFYPTCKTFFYTLQIQMRFNGECKDFNDFISFFSDYLSGKVNAEDKLRMMKYYYNKINIGGTLRDYKSLSEDKILIVSTNIQRCAENESRLYEEKRDGKIYKIPAIYDADRLKFYNIESNLGVDKVLKITAGVKCIAKCNDLHNGLIKGMVVEIVDIMEDAKGDVSCILVKTNAGFVIPVYRYTFETNIYDKTVMQFPLALFYSITAHSTQGKTLDCKVGVALKHFGMESIYKKAFFVAITRIRDPKQLYMDKHPVLFMEPTMSATSLRDIQDVEETINSKNIKRRKLDLPISNMLDVRELVDIAKNR